MAESRSPAWHEVAPAAQRETRSASSEIVSNEARIRVVLVGNQTMVRAGLAHVLGTHARFEVISEGPVAEAVPAVEVHQPDVVVVISDDSPGGSLETIRAIQAVSARAMVLLLRSARDVDADARALAAGVRGVVLLEQPPALLLKAVEKVHAGEVWLDRVRMAGLMQSASRGRLDPEQAKIDSLTARELEIVQLVGAGLRNHEVAKRLFISEATARNHLTSILSKLELADRFDLAVYAFRHGLVRFP